MKSNGLKSKGMKKTEKYVTLNVKVTLHLKMSSMIYTAV